MCSYQKKVFFLHYVSKMTQMLLNYYMKQLEENLVIERQTRMCGDEKTQSKSLFSLLKYAYKEINLRYRVLGRSICQLEVITEKILR